MRRAAERRTGRILDSVIVRKILSFQAPRVAAAFSAVLERDDQ